MGNVKQRGFSLIELIVVIAIMAVLVGVTVPQFLKYVEKNRAKACQVDREGILAVYERCVYGGELDVSTSDLTELLTGAYAKTKTEVEQYNKCPSGGNYSAAVIGSKAYIYCDHTGHDAVVVDFSAWSGTEDAEGSDKPFATPTKKPTPTTVPTATPTAAPTDSPIKGDAVWPYDTDTRWEGKRYPGSSITIETPSPVFTSKEGNRYVIIDKNNSGVYTVNYEWMMGPEYIDGSGWEWVISCSGVTITEPIWNDGWKMWVFNVNYGDIISVGEYQYIYASHWSGQLKWPDNLENIFNGSNQAGGDYGNFYLIGK